MQAYLLEIINLDIYLERGGKEKTKQNKIKINRNEFQSLSQQKTSVRTQQFNLYFCTDDYVGQHRIKYIYIYIYIL